MLLRLNSSLEVFCRTRIWQKVNTWHVNVSTQHGDLDSAPQELRSWTHVVTSQHVVRLDWKRYQGKRIESKEKLMDTLLVFTSKGISFGIVDV